MFKKYFEETKLRQSFTELVIPVAIPAVKNETNPAMTHLFTRYDARKNNGGINLNNPSLTAYTEAIRYKVATEKISVLSLGIRCYIPDPLRPELYRHLLFWAQNLPNLMISGQEGLESIPNLLELGCQYIEELDYSR
ncbi:18312_t:CDS:2 [Gigaspora margarita]|uniref:18312_t:CDS:1 n=1 Tax=Gigaspora margarita TaxID=4874 RepID=A0ABN7UWJ5_GIGMA|nr:18312_t:CDS:2 [Gigaspora margarita]